MRSAFVLVTAALLLACEGSSGAVGPTVELVGPDGRPAAEAIIDGTLHVQIAQGGSVVACGDACSTPIVDGSYEIVADIPSLTALTEIQARTEPTETIGAVRTFQPFGEGLDTGEVPVRLVMLAPDQCSELALPGVRNDGPPRLVAPARDVGVVIRRNLALLVGGVEGDGSGSRVGRFDQIVVETFAGLTTLAEPAGPARGLALTEDDSIVVADGGAWRFEPNLNVRAGGDPILRAPLDVHAGATAASALVDLGEGAAVIAGRASSDVTWLSDGGLRTAGTSLIAPRTAPAAAAIGDGVLVVGGADSGAPVAEWLERGGAGEALSIDGLPEGRGGWLVPSPSADGALWIGWTGPDDAPGAVAYLISGCPDACEATPVGWPRPRLDAAGARTAAGDFWIAGGADADGVTDAVDVIRWAGETPTIEAGPPLVHPRAGATAFEHASGVVTVVGGEGAGGLRADFELCAPGALDPL